MDLSIAGKQVSLLVVMLVAFAVLGIVQHLKGLFKKAPTWVWAISAFALYFILAALYVLLPPAAVVFLAIAVLSMALGQLGYEVIWQALIGWIKTALGISIPAAPSAKPDNAAAGLPGS